MQNMQKYAKYAGLGNWTFPRWITINYIAHNVNYN
jgi:hypothetical protein